MPDEAAFEPGRAAMPDEAELASEREDHDDYDRHLAAEIIAMLPYARAHGDRVLALVHEMRNLAQEPRASD